MSITEAFDGVIPARPAAPRPDQESRRRPSPRPRAHAVPLRLAKARTSVVRRMVQVVYLDAADSWIAEERSPSAKTVWRTDYTAHLDTVWKPYGYWARAYRVAAVLFAMLLDAAKFLLIHPLRGPITLTFAAVGYLAAAHL